MSDWHLNDEECAALKQVEHVIRDVTAPASVAVDRDAQFPTATIQALRERNLLNLMSGKDVGGKGFGLRLGVAICERFARECPSTAMVMKMHHCGTAVLESHGAVEHRHWVSKQQKLTTLAFSEFGSRSHFWNPVSSAERVPNGIKLNASKQLITSAGHADIYLWTSKPAAAEGLSSVWAVPSNTPGVEVKDRYEGIGLRGNASAPIVARDAVIPEQHRMGQDGKGMDIILQTVLPWFSLQNAACSVGMMEGVYARTLQHVTRAKYQYNGTAIADLPQVRGHVARMRLKIDMARGLLLDALDALEDKREDAVLRVLESKVCGAETNLEVHDLAMRVGGGATYRKDNAIERFFRDSRAASVMAPVSDALYEFIGRAVCGMPLM